MFVTIKQSQTGPTSLKASSSWNNNFNKSTENSEARILGSKLELRKVPARWWRNKASQRRIQWQQSVEMFLLHLSSCSSPLTLIDDTFQSRVYFFKTIKPKLNRLYQIFTTTEPKYTLFLSIRYKMKAQWTTVHGKVTHGLFKNTQIR